MINKNPVIITEEEIQNFKNRIIAIENFTSVLESYNIEVKANNTNEKLSKKFYQEHVIMSAILEAFFLKNEITFKELIEFLVNYFPNEFMWNMTVDFQNLTIAKMIRLDLIEVVEKGIKYAPNFRITCKGIEANQQQTFQSLASSSFFNYQTFKLSERANTMNVLMLIVTIMSVIVTLITIFK